MPDFGTGQLGLLKVRPGDGRDPFVYVYKDYDNAREICYLEWV